jgi:hypothetical protein
VRAAGLMADRYLFCSEALRGRLMRRSEYLTQRWKVSDNIPLTHWNIVIQAAKSCGDSDGARRPRLSDEMRADWWRPGRSHGGQQDSSIWSTTSGLKTRQLGAVSKADFKRPVMIVVTSVTQSRHVVHQSR